MNISVIAWDACFREHFHTIDSFLAQDYPKDKYEFIWVDFYTNKNPALLKKIEAHPNVSLLNLNHNPSENWHLGKCINAGVDEAKGDIIVLPDGDIVVQEDHLQVIEDELKDRHEKILYFRRWDEPKNAHCALSTNIDYLEKNTILTNPTNYAGCLCLNRSALDKVSGYEESEIFAGPGTNGKETYIRFRNAGFEIKWHSKKIYHPWHPSTGSSDKYTSELIEVAKYTKWLNPYCGIKQSWALKSRGLDLSFVANDGTMNRYEDNAPALEDLKKLQHKNTSMAKKILKTIFR